MEIKIGVLGIEEINQDIETAIIQINELSSNTRNVSQVENPEESEVISVDLTANSALEPKYEEE